MTIRPATLEDAEVICRLHIASWQTFYRGILADDVVDGLDYDERLEHRRSLLRDPIPGVEDHVLEEAGQLLGWCAIGPVRSKSNPDLAKNTGEIYAFYLDPPAVGKGHGRALCDWVLTRARQRGWQEMILWVLCENERARCFYRAAGFLDDPRVSEREHVGAMTLRMAREL